MASFKLLCDTITMQKICVGVGPCRTGTLYAPYYCALIINVGISGVNHSSTLTMLAATRQQLAVLARLKHDPSRDKTLI